MKQFIKIGKVSRIGIAALLISSVAGCAVPVTQEQSGTVIGGVVGSQFGRGDGRTAATIIGALIGASVGGDNRQIHGQQ